MEYTPNSPRLNTGVPTWTRKLFPILGCAAQYITKYSTKGEVKSDAVTNVTHEVNKRMQTSDNDQETAGGIKHLMLKLETSRYKSAVSFCYSFPSCRAISLSSP